MVNVSKLKELINEKGLSNKDIAEVLKLTESALDKRYKEGIFGADEIQKLVDLLNIPSPESIFFADFDTK